MSLIRLVMLVAPLALGTPVWATTWWVAPCGNDAWSGVSPVCIPPHGPKRTIHAAIANASDGDTINVDAGTYLGNINTFGKAIHIVATDGPTFTFVDGQNSVRGITIDNGEGPDTIIEGLTFIDCVSVTSGGGMLVSGSSPTILDCWFVDNSTDVDGGGAYFVVSDSYVGGCVFDGNSAGDEGGALAMAFVESTIESCHFDGNVADQGGAIAIDDGVVEIGASQFEHNLSDSPDPLTGGGAILARNTTLETTGCDFDNNETVGSAIGAALRVVESDVTINDGLLGGNTVGGAIAVEGGQLALDGCAFTFNESTKPGGAIWAYAQAIVNANACLFSNCASGLRGGAVAFDGASTGSFSDATFQLNHSGNYGGAVSATNGSYVTIDQAALEFNSAMERGGAMYAATLASLEVSGVCFDGNASAGMGGDVHVREGATFLADDAFLAGASALSGGSIYSDDANIHLHDTWICGATAQDGAIYVLGDGVTSIQDALIKGCQAENTGGGLTLRSNAEATISNTTFEDNSALFGGGIHAADTSTVAIDDVVLTLNSAAVTGGAIFATDDAVVDVLNTTVVFNLAPGVGGLANTGATMTAQNSIIWDNGGGEISPSVEASWCLVEGNAAGPGNIDGNPLFQGGGSLKLAAGSPAIDAGNNTFVAGGDNGDHDGNERFVEDPFAPNTGVLDDRAPIDMGAYERQVVWCAGDVDLDGSIGANDLVLILSNWNGPGADITGDGVTNVDDLIIVLTNWGPCV